jgi:hypothetical protein
MPWFNDLFKYSCRKLSKKKKKKIKNQQDRIEKHSGGQVYRNMLVALSLVNIDCLYREHYLDNQQMVSPLQISLLYYEKQTLMPVNSPHFD